MTPAETKEWLANLCRDELLGIFDTLGANDQALLLGQARELSGVLLLVGGPLDGLKILAHVDDDDDDDDGMGREVTRYTFDYSATKHSLYELDGFCRLVFSGFEDVEPAPGVESKGGR